MRTIESREIQIYKDQLEYERRKYTQLSQEHERLKKFLIDLICEVRLALVGDPPRGKL